jgi:WD40 repeat protein
MRSSIKSVLVSPDGKWGLSCSGGPTHLFDLEAGKTIYTWKSPNRFANAAAFSPDSKLVLTGYTDGTAETWDVATQRSIRTFVGRSFIDQVAFSHDAKLVLTRSWSGETALWDATNGKELAQLLSLNDGKDWLALTPEGLYDGSEIGRADLAFRVDGKLKIEPSQSYPAFRRPGLLASLMRGERPLPEKQSAPSP